MSYTRPPANAAGASWEGALPYTRPDAGAAGASWEPAAASQVDAHAAAPSPLGAMAARAHSDWTAGIRPEAPVYYVMDITGAPSLRVSVSSWQATVQLDRAIYVQAVVPAATDWYAALAARVDAGEIVISRGTLAPDGSALEMELARGPLMTVTSDRGTQRHTCTVSGYGAPYDPGAETWPETTRTLTSPRTISQTGSNHRVRCAIDWALRPGMTAVLDDLSFPVAYINYYVGNGDAYMDVGSRVA